MLETKTKEERWKEEFEDTKGAIRIRISTTTQLSKEKGQKQKQRPAKHTYKTTDGVTRTTLKTGGELRCFGRVGRSCSTSDIRYVNLVNLGGHGDMVRKMTCITDKSMTCCKMSAFCAKFRFKSYLNSFCFMQIIWKSCIFIDLQEGDDLVYYP